MSWRAIITGLLFGAALCALTYFNDRVVQQTYLIASHAPVGVLGLLALSVLAIGPMLRRAVRGRAWSPAEIAVAVAIALAACMWPGSGFWRYFPTIVTMPAHWNKASAGWKAAGMMSYVPGAAAEVAPGQVLDWQALATRLLDAEDAASDPLLRDLWSSFDNATREAARDVAAGDVRTVTRHALLRGINAAIEAGALVEAGLGDDAWERSHRARAALAEALPGVILPSPRGGHALVARGQPDPQAVDPLLNGHRTGDGFRPDLVPWATWWPTLRLWGGAMLLFSFACVCLAVIVHPQWSRRELLSYPVARFVEELTRRRDESHLLPDATRSKAFWVPFSIVFGIHVLNGLRVRYPELPFVDLRLNFLPMRDLFPLAYRVPLSFGIFQPTIYFSVIGLAFFLPRSVSFTVGIAHPLYITIGAILLGNGLLLEYAKGPPAHASMLRLGAFLGMTIMIAYTGRRYYGNVVASTFGAARHGDTPAYATWAARLFLPLVAGTIAVLWTAGISVEMATLFVLVLLMMQLVLSRIVCETGMFFVTTPFLPIAALLGVLGFEAIGPTNTLLLTMASWVFIADPRECLMPYLSTGLQLVERGGAAFQRVARWQVVMLVIGFVVAMVATLGLQYEWGVTSTNDRYAFRDVPSSPFNLTMSYTNNAAADGTLPESVAASGLERLGLIDPPPGLLPWLICGLALVLATAGARLTLPWWPLHPVAWLLFGTYAVAHFGFSFLLGFLVRSAVTGTSGARGYHNAKPVMVALVAGELLGVLLWMAVGAIEYLITGQIPVSYAIYP